MPQIWVGWIVEPLNDKIQKGNKFSHDASKVFIRYLSRNVQQVMDIEV